MLRIAGGDPTSPRKRGEVKKTHTFRASTAIRSASPASTVPISQRCTSIQLEIGRAHV